MVDKVHERVKQREIDEEYKLEASRVVDVTSDYWHAARDRHYDMSFAESEFAQGLMEIKNQEIARKSQQSSTLPEK